MKLGTSTNILFERMNKNRVDVRESIRRCLQAGYRYLDFCFVDQVFTPVKTAFTTNRWESYMRDIFDEAEEQGAVFTQSHLPIHDFFKEDQDYAYELDLMHRALIAGSWVGIPWAVAHPISHIVHGKMAEDTMEVNVRYFQDLADVAQKLGVGIALENMWNEAAPGVPRFATAVDELLELHRLIHRPNVGLCWDTMHASAEGISQAEAIRKLGSRLKATHISDEDGRGAMHILPYDGICPWDEIIDALRDIHYQEGFTYELQHYLREADPDQWDAGLVKSYQLGLKMIGG